MWKQKLQLSLPLCVKCPLLVVGQRRAATNEVVKQFLPGKRKRGYVYGEFAHQLDKAGLTSFMLYAVPSSDTGLNLLSDVIKRIDKKGPVE